MELLQLEYFIESAKTENFSKTAEKYMVPASSVSISIKKLEKELGVNLFERTANKIKLNQNGKAFFDSVSSALTLIDSAKEIISPENNISGEINLLIKTERSFANEKILNFRKEFPNINFRLTHSFSNIDHKNFDIIIDELSNQYENYIQKPIIKEKIKIAAAKQNPISKKQLTLNDLKLMPFITMSRGSSLNRITKEFCHKAGFTPNIIIESDDPYYIRKYLKEDFGIAFYPEKSWKNDFDKEICFLNVIDFDYSRMTYIYLNNNKKITKSAKMFFDFFEDI